LYSDPQPSDNSTLSLHDALPILTDHGHEVVLDRMRFFSRLLGPSDSQLRSPDQPQSHGDCGQAGGQDGDVQPIRHSSPPSTPEQDRKSTRLNSSHVKISYAVSRL